MKKQVVTFEQLVDLAISTPESTVNFTILHKVLKLLTKYCCKSDYSFEVDMDNMKGDITVMKKRSQSSISVGRKSYGSIADSGQSYTSDEQTQTEPKLEKDDGGEYEQKVKIKIEKKSQEYLTEQKVYGSSSDLQKHPQSGTEKPKKSRGSDAKDSDDDAKNKKKKKKESKGHKEKAEMKRKSSEKHSKASSDENVKKKDSKEMEEALEDFNKQSENRVTELENQIKELTDRIESIMQIISTHLGEEHLRPINEEIDKLKKNVESTSDQCFDVTNNINDQSSQIQEILTTINNIQLRKVENEELIDLLSGKADHSFVEEKVSISEFEQIVQSLNDVIQERTLQLDNLRLETIASLDDIKQDLLTKLLAEEFDEAKTKIYKELIILTEKHDLILAQQNEHVAAGAKMRNLNCFVCNNDVVMLLEQEIIPKFRPLKASMQPIEPIVGSKIMIDKDAPEFKNHQLKAKDFTRTSKSSRFNGNMGYEKATYVKGKNGCMYKGNVGCDCVEGMNAIGRRGNCCDTVDAMNKKNISLTNRMNSESKCIDNTGVGDVPNVSDKTDQKKSSSEKIPTGRQENNLKKENNIRPPSGIKVVESLEVAQSKIIQDINEIKNEIDATIDKAVSSVPSETNEIHENKPIDGNLTIKIEKDDSVINTEIQNETNSVPQVNIKVEK